MREYNNPYNATVHDAAAVPKLSIQRSKLNRSHTHKTTFDEGYLVPICVDEILPGDTASMQTQLMARLPTLLHPIMDQIILTVMWWFVPLRLVYSNFQKLMGEQVDPGDSIDYEIPMMHAPATTGYTVGSLADYFGLPTDVPDYKHSALPFRAYGLIWNEFYRSQALQDSVTVALGDGPDTTTNTSLLRRGKAFDYFTAALPWPQKGDDEITLPLGSAAPVKGIGKTNQTYGDGPNQVVYETGETGTTTFATSAAFGTSIHLEQDPANSGFPSIWTDLTEATAASINDLRQAMMLQHLLELDSRGGTRYTEVIRTHFHVTSPDARLQRPEFLGGGVIPMVMQQVAATNEAASVDLGDLAGFGMAVGDDSGFTKSFTEHGILMGLIQARAPLTYQTGLHKMWTRETRYDFFWPALQHIGEQGIKNQEIYCRGSDGTGWVSADDPGEDHDIFGYIPRYDEYRYKPNMITGELRSTYATPLDSWHLAQDFGDPDTDAAPVLDSTFIQDTPPIARVVAAASEPHFILDARFNYIHSRPMAVYSIPGLGMRF